jgi:chemotaxis protein MotB
MQKTRYVALPTLLAAMALSNACVSKSKYQVLETRLKETEGKLAQRAAEADQLQTSLKSESAKATDLSQKASTLEQKASTLEKKASTLEQKASSLEKTVTAVRQDKSVLESSLTQVQTDNDKLRTALAELEKNKAETDKRVAEYQDLLSKFKSMIDSGRLRVRIVDGRMVVALNSDLLFKSGSANLTSDGQKSVQEVAGLLQTLTDKSFQIEGHTDNVAISGGKFANNWELAAARAISVLKKMVDAGMPESRISAASYGESKPARANDTKDGRASNRRVEIVVVPDLSKLPGFEALNKLDETPAASAPKSSTSR